MIILGTAVASLLNSLWQSTAIALLAWAALRFLPRVGVYINAATRCAIWWAVLTAVVGAHLVLDLVTGVQLFPGGQFIGLFDRVPHFHLVDFGLEAAIVIAGWFVYRRSLAPPRRRRWQTLAMLGLMLGAQALFDVFYVRTTPQPRSSGGPAALKLLAALAVLIATVTSLTWLDRSGPARTTAGTA
jgi:hypothetical protein